MPIFYNSVEKPNCGHEGHCKQCNVGVMAEGPHESKFGPMVEIHSYVPVLLVSEFDFRRPAADWSKDAYEATVDLVAKLTATIDELQAHRARLALSLARLELLQPEA